MLSCDIWSISIPFAVGGSLLPHFDAHTVVHYKVIILINNETSTFSVDLTCFISNSHDTVFGHLTTHMHADRQTDTHTHSLTDGQ